MKTVELSNTMLDVSRVLKKWRYDERDRLGWLPYDFHTRSDTYSKTALNTIMSKNGRFMIAFNGPFKTGEQSPQIWTHSNSSVVSLHLGYLLGDLTSNRRPRKVNSEDGEYVHQLLNSPDTHWTPYNKYWKYMEFDYETMNVGFWRSQNKRYLVIFVDFRIDVYWGLFEEQEWPDEAGHPKSKPHPLSERVNLVDFNHHNPASKSPTLTMFVTNFISTELVAPVTNSTEDFI